ncbi:MAG: M20/M25/M40 family metallo-hydrolase, partial [Microbacteriaceae bacterium]
VGTVGEIRFSPEASNVVSEFAHLNAEFRSPHQQWFIQAREQLEAAVQEESSKRGVTGSVEWMPPEPPTPMADSISQKITDSVSLLGHEAVRLYSGAGHDAVQMAKLGPAGMIFIPSVDGRSHCPEEFTDIADISLGIHALAQSVLELDRVP